ncbi:hypothetical protein [Actinosynnema sp. ALI-1.44]|uniref:hypothetical protein n=1 Tax=Actinosynnema sp. ALI-1.44 TaxID=1933779 RepID=UPI001876859A|nr:hypothetical protein [Actinosynnema sp. ALI-1.44]
MVQPNRGQQLDGLGEPIWNDGASLYLDAHEGFLRASLAPVDGLRTGHRHAPA